MKYEIVIPKGEPKRELNCPFDFTSRCTMGRCDCKPKQETLEWYEEALNQFPEYNQYLERIAFEKGVEWQAERSYNEDEVKTIINDIVEKHCTYFSQGIKNGVKLEWFKKFKK